MRPRPGQRPELYQRLVRQEAEKVVRVERVIEFFIRQLGVGWKRILHKRGVISEDSTARWVCRQQIPRWPTINALEDYAATLGFVPAPRKGRQARAKPRQRVAVVPHQSTQDRVRSALASTTSGLENRDIASPQVHALSTGLQNFEQPVSISCNDSSLSKDYVQQLDFLNSLSPNDLQK